MKKNILILLLLLGWVINIEAQRINTTINSAWRFHKGGVNTSAKNVNTDDWEIINLPHTWNAQDAFDETPGYYRGIGWYAKELTVPQTWEGKRVFLKFEGANQVADVYLNGALIGSHIGGYTGFGFDLSADLKYGGINTITVRVNNEHDDNIPPLNADFTFYGGIYRNVSLIVTEPVHFELDNDASDGIFVSTPIVNEQSASVNFRGRVENNTGNRKNAIVEVLILDKSNKVIAEKTAKIVLAPNSKSDFSLENLQITSPELWSPDRPYLYQTITRVKEDTDDLAILDKIVVPLGLRWYKFDEEGRFWLNGKPLKLIGANRHQDFEGLGNALPDSYHYNDYKKIKELGFNFIRTAHYPQAPEVYRTCDELGLLAWSEIPVVSGISESEEFAQNCLNMQREHIRQTYNHPSLIIYGYMNEIFLGFQYNRSLSEADRKRVINATVDLAGKLEELTKTEAPERFTVMALHHSTQYNDSGITDIPDVVGWNLYFGWYYQEMEDLSTFLKDQHERYPNRPMIVSEYGPGTDARLHAKTPKPYDYSEDYQYVMHASYLEQMMDLPFLAGFAAWNFADFGSERRGDAIPQVNQKGLVNFDRTEKDITGMYRAYFLKEPVVYIAAHNYTKRTGVEDSAGSGIATESVKVFSNQKRVELMLNGKSLGQKTVEDHMATFAIPFRNGKNELRAVDANGHSDQVTIAYTLIPFQLNAAGIQELAVNVGAEVSFYDPETQITWVPDRKYTAGGWGYEGGAPYTVQQRQVKTGIDRDILGTDNDPLFQTFVEGLTSYRFDVPDGQYTLNLCFQEPVSRDRQNNMYNLTRGNASESKVEDREFTIAINGQDVVHNVNLERDYGSLRALTLDFTVNAEDGNGIKVDFQSKSGKALLSGIRIKKR
ncbi:MAG: glycoside hydrolase family 2 TIM barrel-domain containing protein [Saprospiraceae bacterium]